MSVKVTSTQTVSNIDKIYLNDKLHLLFKEENVNSLQSWIENDTKYVIEITFNEGEALYAAYDKRDVWEAVLAELDKLIY